jgi:enoyl-CoA hydratase/carnithine racemase
MNDRVTYQLQDGVAHVRLTRTDSMNALDNAMFEALVATGDALKTLRGVRCVVLSGEGRAFCAGLDKNMFGRLAAQSGGGGGAARSLGPRTHGIANRAQYAVTVWRELPVPVIAAVHGFAFGGGFQLTLGADFRIVAPDTKLSIMEVKWGLIPDMAGTLLMRTLAREDIVRELTYTGRIFSGTEALQYGFATHLSADPTKTALEMAREIAGKSPDAIRTAKRIFNQLPARNAAAVLLAESQEQDLIFTGANHAEAVAANLENRAPKFIDP